MAVSLHETCLEYFRRRLSEGWRCISLEGYKAVLLSPEGLRRELDLRNDVETLRPSAPGDETGLAIGGGSPAATNWESVDEAIADDIITTVKKTLSSPGTESAYDLYNLPASSGSGPINHVTVYMRCQYQWAGNGNGAAKTKIKTYATEYEGDEEFLDTEVEWETFNHQWVQNPHESAAWTWDEIDALQIGVWLEVAGPSGGYHSQCTQVYVEVDHTPPYSPATRSAGMAAKMIAGKLI